MYTSIAEVLREMLRLSYNPESDQVLKALSTRLEAAIKGQNAPAAKASLQSLSMVLEAKRRYGAVDLVASLNMVKNPRDRSGLQKVMPKALMNASNVVSEQEARQLKGLAMAINEGHWDIINDMKVPNYFKRAQERFQEVEKGVETGDWRMAEKAFTEFKNSYQACEPLFVRGSLTPSI